jgi:succinate dehydrogenase / fumarate reductase flavoprotein subunit
LYAAGEANFSDHGANRLGASALMQGLADGYFVLPYTIQNYLSHEIQVPRFSTELKEFDDACKSVQERINKLMSIGGRCSVDHFQRQLGKVMWDKVGMARTKESLTEAIAEIQAIREEFWQNVRVTGERDEFNPELEKALRTAEHLELGELMARDALLREESCGGHFREEFQTPEGEALRQDADFMFVSCWEYRGADQEPELHKVPLNYESIKIAQRNYKE